MSEETILKKSRRRKPSPTPRMRSVAVRLPEDVIAWYKNHTPYYTTKMRDAIIADAKARGMKEPSPPLDTVKE